MAFTTAEAVIAVASVDDIVAIVPAERVVAISAVERVIALTTTEAVIAIAAVDNVIGRGTDAVILQGRGRGASRACDRAFEQAVRIGQQVGSRYADAELAVGIDLAGEGFGVDGERDFVARLEDTGDLAGDDAVAGVVGGHQHVVSADAVDLQGGLGRRGAGFDHVVLRGGGGVAIGVGQAGLDAGVGVGLEIGHGDGHAVAACSIQRGGPGLAVEAEGDHIALGVTSVGLSADPQTARLGFVGIENVVEIGTQRIHHERGAGTGLGVGIDAGGQRVALDRRSGGATGAGDAASHGGVGVLDQVIGGDGNAEGTVGRRLTGKSLAVDVQRDDIAGCVFAGHRAGDPDVAGVFGLANHVVGGDRVNRQAGLGQGAASLDGVVLRGRGGVAAGAGHAGLDLGVRVGLEIGHGHIDAETAVSRHRGGVGFAIEFNLHQVASRVSARDLAADLDGGRLAFGSGDDVVARDRIEGNGGFEALIAGRFTGGGAATRRRGDTGRTGQACCSEQRVEQHQAQRRARTGDFGAAERHVDRLCSVLQLRDQATGVGVFGDVFVEVAVFGLAHHRVVALGHDRVVVLEDQAGLGLVFEQDLQVLADTPGLDVMGRKVLARLDFLQLVLGASHGLETDHLATCAIALGDLLALVVFGVTGAYDDFEVFLGHFFPLGRQIRIGIWRFLSVGVLGFMGTDGLAVVVWA